MKKQKQINYLRSLINRTLITIILFLILAILSKSNYIYKNKILTNLYETNFSFAKIKNIYTKYLGGVVPLDKISIKTNEVFNEELVYNNTSIFHDGVKLEVSDNYLVPILEEGMVVYIGKKERYGNVIIIEGVNDIEIWYGNVENTTVKLYDYVEKNTYLGQTKDNILYLVYSKDGVFLDYEEYLK